MRGCESRVNAKRALRGLTRLLPGFARHDVLIKALGDLGKRQTFCGTQERWL